VKERFYTIMLIPQKSKGVRKWVLSAQRLRVLGYLAALLIVILMLNGVFALSYLLQRHRFAEAELKVRYLEENLRAMENRFTAADATLSRIQNFEQKLRVITRLEDSSRNVAMGPLSKDEDRFLHASSFDAARVAEADLQIPDEYRFELKETDLKLGELGERATLQEQTMHELYELLQDQKALLSHTPSVWPVHGWVTSGFGYRASPFTGRIQMHEGLDIATRIGMPVTAPADGIIVRVNTLEGFGKTIVIDHGYGVTSAYGHNSEILVKAGELIKRGQVIAKAGNTGISTGPHVHYEVRVNGVPVDPRKYILD
jgi:murein DD-endopeptidase MepM/ murein hydrolase activator NlpD